MSELKFRAAGLLGAGLVGALLSTVRVSQEGREHLDRARREHGGVIFILWHDQLLPLVHHHRHEGVVVLVSEHADGEYITRIMLRLGLDAVRGSSTRGGARGLRALVRAGRAGRDLAITPDGPRGPRHRVKEGALMAARMTGLPMVPIVAGTSSAWRFDSWDRFMVPRPFSRIQVRYGPPVRVERDASRKALTRVAEELGETLVRLTREARAAVGAAPEREADRAPAS